MEHLTPRTTSPADTPASGTVATALADALVALGIRRAFGVSGGGVAHIWSALGEHPALQLVHTQHEGGASFAATEASLATASPVVVFGTTGPGLTNLLTGLVAARQEGACVIAITGMTPAERRGRGATQETSPQSLWPGLFAPGAVFDMAEVLEDPRQLPTVLAKLAEGVAQPGGFVAHIAVPGAQRTAPHRSLPPTQVCHPRLGAAATEQLARDLATARQVRLVVGYEARHATERLTELADRLDATVVVTPRAKGVFPEDHPRCLGVVGLAGTAEALLEPADQVLCLGTRLGEASSQWQDALLPAPGGRMVLVHPRGDATGAYPDTAHLLVRAAVDQVVDDLIRALPASFLPYVGRPRAPRRAVPMAVVPGTVHPEALMAAVQRVVVEGSGAHVMAASGNSFAWAIRHLRFPRPRFRVSVGWGSMGHCTSGVIGIAATGQPAVAIVGDGAMLMMNEVATAVRHRLPAVWVVLVDGRYGMCAQGTAMLGLPSDCTLPPVDFAAWARAMGAHGLTVDTAAGIAPALTEALAHGGPVVVAVHIDPTAEAPIGRRVAALTFHEEVSP